MQIYKLKTFVNDLNPTLLLFTILCCLFLNPIVTGNEEIYLGWAKAYYDPDWMPNSFVYDHWVSHRYLFEIFFGFLLNQFSFEVVVVIGRILAAGAMAYALSQLFRQIKLTNLESLLVVVGFIFCGQNILPGEFIFLSVESKVFAYPLIFLSLAELLKGKPKVAALFITIATYFHVIVAGWFFIYFFIYLIWIKTNLFEVAKVFAIYLAGTLPLAVYLAPTVFSGPSEVNGIHLNWIYVFFRIPNLAPFVEGNLNEAAGWEVIEILTIAVFFVLAIFMQCRNKIRETVKPFNNFIIIIGAFIFTFLAVGYFDRSGDILKFRPFRGDSLFLFFVLIDIILIIKLNITHIKTATIASRSFIAILAICFAYQFGDNINRRYIEIYLFPDKKITAWNEVTSFAKNNTNKGTIFLIKGIDEKITRTFPRMSNRDTFVLKRFIPIDKNKWYEWYQRLQVRMDNEDQMTALKKKYQLDYYITIPSRPRIGEVVFENSHYVISRLHASQ